MRPLMLRVTTLLLGIVIALALAELFLRVFRLVPTISVVTVTESDFEKIPGIFAPNQTLIDRQIRALPHSVTTNDLGYRGKEFPFAKPGGVLRVLTVGDSYTYGSYVDNKDTLPVQLQKELRTRCGRVRVINAGVGGSTIVTHVEMVRRALPLNPGLVLLTFTGNDIEELTAPLWYSLAKNRQLKSRLPLSVAYPIIRRTALWNFGLVALRKRRGALLQRVDVTLQEDHDYNISNNAGMSLYNTYSDALIALRDSLLKQGIPLAFAVYPSHHSVRRGNLSQPEQWAVRTALESGITTIDLLPPLRESGHSTETLYLLPHDGHPSRRGYAISAKFLAEKVDQIKTLAAFCNRRTN